VSQWKKKRNKPSKEEKLFRGNGMERAVAP
jgi:hypothetical protein